MKRNRPCDFVVRCRFLTKEEGGRQTGLPIQGIRSDFMYYGDNPKIDRIFMIHPKFLDNHDNVITQSTVVPESEKHSCGLLTLIIFIIIKID
jgi:hypothetical protein